MRTHQELLQKLSSIDGRGYPAYKDLKGAYSCQGYRLLIDHIQSDPYAPPSRVRIQIPKQVMGIPEHLIDTKDKQVATSDFLTRAFAHGIRKTGSKALSIAKAHQEVLERTSVLIFKDFIEFRFLVSMPAAGRRILGREASKIFQFQLPEIVQNELLYKSLNQSQLNQQVTLYLNQQYLRQQLELRNLVAFIGNGAILPRESGITEKPMQHNCIPFQSPQNLLVTMVLPNGEQIQGMGIPTGITVIVGGGYHGKSTLLHALEMGVYNHVAGDGREYVITRADSVKVRAEDGRSVKKVDISPFINNLPGKTDTTEFSTDNASGSTSQAANVMEAIEAGSKLLLIDEDTSATNFMIRDGRMQKLIAKEKEPITPFIDRVITLYQEKGISTILITGGSGDYLQIADKVIMMDEYVPIDVTARAKEIAQLEGYERETDSKRLFGEIVARIPIRKSFLTKNGKDYFRGKGRDCILFGKSAIDVSYLEQLTDEYQANGIAAILEYLKKNKFNDNKSLIKACDELFLEINKEGFHCLCDDSIGNLVLPRKQEVMAALNRYRELMIQ